MGTALLLGTVLAAVLKVWKFGCHLCLQSKALPFDSSIYLANEPGYKIMELAELPIAGRNVQDGAVEKSPGQQFGTEYMAGLSHQSCSPKAISAIPPQAVRSVGLC